jgi:hypothetical protein
MARTAKTAPLRATRRREPAEHLPSLTCPSSPAAGRKSLSGQDHFNNSFRHLDAALANMTQAEFQSFFPASPASIEQRDLRHSGSLRQPSSSSCSNISADSGETFRDLDEVLARIREHDSAGGHGVGDTPKVSGQSAAQSQTTGKPANLPKMRRTTREASQAPPLPLPEPPSLKWRFARKFKSLVSNLALPIASARPPHGF